MANINFRIINEGPAPYARVFVPGREFCDDLLGTEGGLWAEIPHFHVNEFGDPRAGAQAEIYALIQRADRQGIALTHEDFKPALEALAAESFRYANRPLASGAK